MATTITIDEFIKAANKGQRVTAQAKERVITGWPKQSECVCVSNISELHLEDAEYIVQGLKPNTYAIYQKNQIIHVEIEPKKEKQVEPPIKISDSVLQYLPKPSPKPQKQSMLSQLKTLVTQVLLGPQRAIEWGAFLFVWLLLFLAVWLAFDPYQETSSFLAGAIYFAVCFVIRMIGFITTKR